jgi:hypothetical protein
MSGDRAADHDGEQDLTEQLILLRAQLQDAFFRERVAEEAIRQLIRHGPVELVADVLSRCESPWSDALPGDVAYLIQHVDDQEADR